MEKEYIPVTQSDNMVTGIVLFMRAIKDIRVESVHSLSVLSADI